ncbi:MAG: hypothetical protein KGZ31_03085 [Sulfuritalea sp.]|nr:hypothetical protein [Sulfuritalea sp.]
MFGSFMPKEGRFFDYFDDLAEHIVRASRELAELMASFDEVERRAYNIESIEKDWRQDHSRGCRDAARDLHHAARPRQG